MPLLGLIDWIIIALIGLIVWAGIITLFLAWLGELFQFKKNVGYRDSTHFYEANGEFKIIEAPHICSDVRFDRRLKRKWYHEIIFDL